MIIGGGLLLALGVAGLVGLSFWPMILIGLGAGMMLSGVVGKGWPRRTRRGRGRPRGRERRRDAGDQSSAAAYESL
jgi:hypothetical protein